MVFLGSEVKKMDEKMLLEAIGQMIQPIREDLAAVKEDLSTVKEDLASVKQRLDAIEHKSDVLMTGVKLANSKLSQVVASQNYTLEQLDILDEVKLDKDPMRKRA